MNVHHNLEQGRHDDLWSWLFMMIEFIKGELPWRMEPDRQKVAEIKVSSKREMLSQLPEEIPKMYDSITVLRYLEDPSYESYRKTINGILKKKRVSNSDPFDWEEGVKSTRETKGPSDLKKQQIKSKQKVIKKEEKEKESEKSGSEVSSTRR